MNQCEERIKKKNLWAHPFFYHPVRNVSCVHTCTQIFYIRVERASSKIGPTATACSLHVKRIQWTVNCTLILIAAFIRLVITRQREFCHVLHFQGIFYSCTIVHGALNLVLFH